MLNGRKEQNSFLLFYINCMEEIWKDIPGYEGLYEVSNFGFVRNYKTKEILHFGFNRDYLSVTLYDKDGKKKKLSVHILVAKGFIDNPENKPKVHHINFDKLNNRAENLMWVTSQEHNDIHQSKHVICLDLNYNFVKEYNSIRSTAKDGFNPTNVMRCCHHKPHYLTSNKHIFMFKDEYERRINILNKTT